MTQIHAREVWLETPSGWILDWQAQEAWCVEFCSNYWYRSNGVFWFEEADDAVYFALRWG